MIDERDTLKVRYLNGDRYFCPFCAQRNIWYGNIQGENDFGYRECLCHSCWKRWKEIYELTNIEEIE